MIKEWIDFIRRKTEFLFPKQNYVEAQAKPTTQKSNNNKTYLIDPSVPSLIIDQSIPATTVLPVRATGDTGIGGQPLGSIPQQAIGLKQMVNDALIYLNSKSPKKLTRWAATGMLNLDPRAGKDINAYYDRSSLRFFFFPDNILKKTIYACDSRSVVTHELGHAVLDILRPDLWSAQAAEIWAYHEAFGDMTALVISMQYEQIIDKALSENGGDLYKSNSLTRLAAEMGIGLYHLTGGKGGENPNCLRDMSMRFDYVPPENLPSTGPDNTLINEPHSFSRVFSNMFYRMLLAIADEKKKTGLTTKAALIASRDTVIDYLLKATINAPMTTKFFRAVCQEMLLADQRAGSKYYAIMLKIFQESKIMTGMIKMLGDLKINDVIQNIKGDYEIENVNGSKVIRILNTKTLKLSDKMGVVACANNPLLNYEVEVAAQAAYYFDSNDKLEAAEESTQTEAINAALVCLNYLNRKNMVDGSDIALFEIKDNKIVRKQISCGCNKPNYCIPGSPEYQKPWKPANNGGCMSCKHTNCKPRSCDCNPPEPTPAPKIGCYTNTKSNGIKSYRIGYSTSRRVC